MVRMFDAGIDPSEPKDGIIRAKAKTVQAFRDGLAQHAPLPWEIRGAVIYDANNVPILQGPAGEVGLRVLLAAMTGVATCGGYALEN